MSSKTPITQEGYEKLIAELAELRLKKDRLITQIEEVAQPDEAGEDALATQLKEELEVVNDKIDSLDEALENPQIINGKMPNGDTVQVGHKVTIKISGNATKEFHLVSHLEANPMENKVSDQSPLGLALIGKKIGDSLEVDAPIGKLTYKIVSIA